MSENEVNITYETLFDLVRVEKSRPQLQELKKTFFEDVIEYIKDKETMLQKDDDLLFSQEEKEKTAKQLQNIKKMLKNLYELRERKIINLAMIKSRTGTNIMDMSQLLAEERQFFEEATICLNRYRNGIIDNILKAKLPAIAQPQSSSEPQKQNLNKMVRFTQAVPKFVGRDLEVYGPFEEEDVANLPNEIAELLISKQSAEEIKES